MRRLLFVVAMLLFATLAQAQTTSYTLIWTAPGDDGTVGTASRYEMRWRAVAPDTSSQAAINAWWVDATPVVGLPTPAIAGTTQSVSIGGFATGTRYYFIIRTADESSNVSPFSNLASKFTPDGIPPARIVDLR